MIDANESIITLKEGEFVSIFESDRNEAPVMAFINGQHRHIDDKITVETSDDCMIIIGQPEKVTFLEKEWDRTLFMAVSKADVEERKEFSKPIQTGWENARMIDIPAAMEKVAADYSRSESNG